MCGPSKEYDLKPAMTVAGQIRQRWRIWPATRLFFCWGFREIALSVGDRWML